MTALLLVSAINRSKLFPIVFISRCLTFLLPTLLGSCPYLFIFCRLYTCARTHTPVEGRELLRSTISLHVITWGACVGQLGNIQTLQTTAYLSSSPKSRLEAVARHRKGDPNNIATNSYFFFNATRMYMFEQSATFSARSR